MKEARFSLYEGTDINGIQSIKIGLGNSGPLPPDTVTPFTNLKDLLERADNYFDSMERGFPNINFCMSVRMRPGTNKPPGFNKSRWNSMKFHAAEQREEKP